MNWFEGEAPGRVNLIGEHTDYNQGLVLPSPIPQTTRALLRPKPPGDRTVTVESTLFPEGAASYVLGEEKAGAGWLDYVQGITQLLAKRGHAIPGFELRIESRIPVGSGLSSSAALEVSV